MKILQGTWNPGACKKKKKYPDKKTVQTVINRFMKNGRGRHGNPEELATYFCDYCKAWHLTSQIEPMV